MTRPPVRVSRLGSRGRAARNAVGRDLGPSWLRWADRRAGGLLAAIGVCAIALRALLALGSPWEYGFIWDPYYETIPRTFHTGRLPASTDCFECYQPPLFTLLGTPLYALGRALSTPRAYPHDSGLLAVEALPLAASLACLYFTHRFLRLFRFRPSFVALGVALASSLPVLFFSSYSLEPDLLLGAIITAFAYHLARWYVAPAARSFRFVATVGALAGLAALTKYSGLVAATAGALLFGERVFSGERRRHALGQLALFMAATLAIGAWPYAMNVLQHGSVLYTAHTPASFDVLAPPYWRQYEFATFRLRELLELTRPDARPGMLTLMPAYNSVWTTLHGLTWSDLGFFSNPTRHGSGLPLYRFRLVPPWLASSVLALGLLPTALALAGAGITLGRRTFRPLAFVAVVGMTSYLLWVVSQRFWALKTKYLLFLLPVWVVYAMAAVRWTVRRLPEWASAAVIALLVALVALSHLYQLWFAIS